MIHQQNLRPWRLPWVQGTVFTRQLTQDSGSIDLLQYGFLRNARDTSPCIAPSRLGQTARGNLCEKRCSPHKPRHSFGGGQARQAETMRAGRKDSQLMAVIKSHGLEAKLVTEETGGAVQVNNPTADLQLSTVVQWFEP